MSERPTIPGRFTSLDGWRGICAVLVALYHFHSTSHIEQWGIVRHAYLFVDFFIVLSGFVITYAYGDRIRSWNGAGVMIWRRLGRLWPLHVAMLGAFVALDVGVPLLAAVGGIQRSASSMFDPSTNALLSAIPTNLLLVHGLGIHDRLTWNFASWSISTEFWTSILFAAIAVLGRRWSITAACGLIVVSTMVLVEFSTRYLAVDFELGIFRCILGFFVGSLVYRLTAAVPARVPNPTLCELGAVIGICVFVSLAGRSVWEFVAPFAFGATVWLFAQERGAVSALLRSPPCAKLGLYSYSIYMVHSFVIGIANRLVTIVEQKSGLALSFMAPLNGGTARIISFGDDWLMDVVVMVYLAAVIGLAFLTWRWIEMPAQRIWNGRLFWLTKGPGDAPAVPAAPAVANTRVLKERVTSPAVV